MLTLTETNLTAIQLTSQAICLISIAIIYWFIVIQVASVIYLIKNSPTLINWLSLIISDQLGHTQGLFMTELTK